MENQGEMFLVKGCGFSVICRNRDEVLAWVRTIVERGDFPEIQRWSQTMQRV